MKKLLLLFSFSLYWCISQLSNAQQVAMQGWYWDYPKTGQGYNWSDTLRLKAPSLGQAGFTHVWYPPFAGNGNKSGGYDPKDLFVGPAQTSLGYLDQIKAMVSSFTAAGITPVADMVYNHRDAGAAEDNPAVKDYITKFASGSGQYGFKRPFPSDRYRMVIPIGGNAAEGAGTYFIKMRSRGNIFNGAKYAFHATTNKIGGSRWSPVVAPDINLTTSADQFQYTVQLGRNFLNRIDSDGDVDEFAVTVTLNDFNAAGDFLVIEAVNYESEYSDHLPIEIWYQRASDGITYNIANYQDPFSPNYKLVFQTYTNFSNMPSGRGALDWNGFRPHFTSSSPAGWSQTTSLGPQFSMQSLDYFYDYDHNIPATRDLLIEWTNWAYDELGSKGIRMDAVKHFEPSFVANMLNEMNRTNRKPNMVVGEWYAENADELKGWVDAVTSGLNSETRSAVPVKVFDFSLRRALKDALDNGANARQVFFSSLRDAKGMSGFNVMTFLNNHDFRSSNPSYGDALVHNNPILGYAYLLTNNQLGVPTVFYPDYYGYPARNSKFGTDTYGFDYHPTGLNPMQEEIDQLIKVLQRYINNSPGVDYLNHYGGTGNGPSAPNDYIEGSHNRCLLYQLKAPGHTGKEVIVAINFGDTRLRVDHLITIRNGIAQGTRFTDILGKSAFPYAQVDDKDRIYIELPAKSYSVWVQDVAPLSSTLAITPSNGAICAGQLATLTATATGGTAPYTYTFSKGVSQTEPGAVGTATESGQYSVTVTDALGLTTVATVNLTVNPVSTATLSPNSQAVCPGQPVTLTASPADAASYTFEGPSGATIIPSGNVATVDKTGTYTVTVTSKEGCSTTSDPVSVTVEDNSAPIVKTKDFTLSLDATGQATLSVEQIDNGSSDNCGIPANGYQLNQTSFDCRHLGPNTVTLTVTDNNGNKAAATAVVTVVGAIPAPVVTITRTDNTFTGGDASTLFLGYGAQALILSAADNTMGSTSFFSWVPADGLSNATAASPLFTPTAPGNYTFTVTATNQYGCQSTANVSITVVDARCGNGKVALCHQSDNNPLHEKTLCLDANAVEAHLQKGCRLGLCMLAATTYRQGQNVAEAVKKALVVNVAPNPSNTYFRISIEYGQSAESAQLKVYDLKGRLVENRSNIALNTVFELGRNYRSGVYLLEIWLGKERKQLKLIKVANE
ncbi:MAG TPA: alpha-amylase family glycosyl hydrolase [Flavisolibacter sp.]|nr:alpha-amylase family glycosyl hydrolase [Flavisolibacter sp.]